MRKHCALWSCGLALGLALGVAEAGLAEEPAPATTAAMATLRWTQPLVVQADEPVQAATAIGADVTSDTALDDLAGRGTDGSATVALTEQSLSAVNTGNTLSAGTIASGAISLQDSALSGFAGISNVMMNTGHNNNLQSSMSVTVIITP